jgi:hypothetical protein
LQPKRQAQNTITTKQTVVDWLRQKLSCCLTLFMGKSDGRRKIGSSAAGNFSVAKK